jgi:undecaprenyl-diphosphatase
LELLKAIILGLVQGFTEFIPISSSGHLILVGNFLQFDYSGLAFDTALNIGTLAALGAYFWKDFWNLAHDFVMGGKDRKLAGYILIATLPAVVFGVLVQDLAETVFRSNVLVAFNLIWVAILMLAIDRMPQLIKAVQDIKLPQSIIVGFAQALALIPGTSRSGITIIAGRALKMDRVTATRFSFLLSAPVITGATLKLILSDSTLSQMGSMPSLYIGGIVGAFIAGYLSIKFLIKYLSKNGLAIFAYYRIVLGILILLSAGAM